jgi:hypothetical protein
MIWFLLSSWKMKRDLLKIQLMSMSEFKSFVEDPDNMTVGQVEYITSFMKKVEALKTDDSYRWRP